MAGRGAGRGVGFGRAAARGGRGYASGVPTRLTRPPPQAARRALRNSAWLRAGLLAAVVGLAVWGLASQWTEVRADLSKLAWYDVTGSALAAGQEVVVASA